MKRRCSLICCALCAVTAFARPNSVNQTIGMAAKDLSSKIQPNTVVCVVNIQCDSEPLSQYILDALSTQLVQIGKQTIVERNNLDAVQKELDFQLSGEVSDESAQSIGKKLGAKTIISGTIEQDGKEYRLRVIAIDVETAAYVYSGYYSFVKDAALERIQGTAFPQTSFGFFIEGNMNSSVGAVPGAGVQLSFMPLRSLAIGAKGTASFDLSDIWTFEPAGYLRWYARGKQGTPDSGFFVQGDGGATIILRNSKTVFSPMGGITGGVRFAGGTYFTELYARFGYPFVAGAGISVGVRF